MVLDNKSQKRDTKFELPESQKYKLTLGIDREIVRKAKIADINISFWTEQLLKIMTYEETEIKTSHEDVLQTWYTFLLEIAKMLKKYEIEEVELGRVNLYTKTNKPNTVGDVVGYKIWALTSNGNIIQPEIDLNDEYIYPENSEEFEKVMRTPAPKLSKELINNLWPRGIFNNPIGIIEDLLWRMTESSKVNKSKIKEMKVALRVLKLMSENGENNNDNNTGGK
jgi:hypothetical protein